jgi:hypothetical protein
MIPMLKRWLNTAALIVTAIFIAGCGKHDHGQSDADAGNAHGHTHKAPHGGTVVALGAEECHLELVLDGAAGRLTAYVLDGHLEKFIRIPAASFDVVSARFDGEKTLSFSAEANTATGETVGDTSQFSVQADWLKNARSFDGELQQLTVRGKTYESVKFNFPRGNEAPSSK